jgi:integrase
MKHIIKRRNGYYANLRVPEDVKDLICKTRYFKSLKTSDPVIAQERAGAFIASWKQDIRLARQNLSGIPEDRFELLEHIEVERSTIPAEHLWAYDDAIVDLAETRSDLLLYPEATGQLTKTVLLLSEYIQASSNTEKTKDMQRSDVLRFAKDFPHFENITNKAVKSWFKSLDLKLNTQRRIRTAISSYWNWCVEERDLSVPSCLDGVVPPQSKAKSARKQDRAPYTDSDYRRLLKGSEGDPVLNDLIRLGAYTGCRIEELCSLKLVDVSSEAISIVDPKTPAGKREIPLHKEIRQLVARLKDTSTDGYLISGLGFNKYGNRSNAVGKRFGRLKRKLGFGPSHVFHSFRNTLARKLEEAGIPENIAARIVGHEFSTMTYGLYSGGVSLEVKQEAINEIGYL